MKKRSCSGFVWFSIGQSGGFMWTSHWIFGFIKWQKLLEQLGECWILKEDSARSSYLAEYWQAFDGCYSFVSVGGRQSQHFSNPCDPKKPTTSTYSALLYTERQGKGSNERELRLLHALMTHLEREWGNRQRLTEFNGDNWITNVCCKQCVIVWIYIEKKYIFMFSMRYCK
jgi:hypothetical protein